jgi:catalase
MNDNGRKPTTTDVRLPALSDEFSLAVGPDGRILLQDHNLIEQMANFNRERDCRTSVACQVRRLWAFGGNQG